MLHPQVVPPGCCVIGNLNRSLNLNISSILEHWVRIRGVSNFVVIDICVACRLNLLEQCSGGTTERSQVHGYDYKARWQFVPELQVNEGCGEISL